MFSPTTCKDALTTMNFSRDMIFALLILAVLVTAGSFTPGTLAQGNTSGGFRGVVRDKATGSPVAGARVVLRNRQFGTQATVITGDNGTYSKGSLPPGDYDIEVSASGYVTQAKVQTLYAMASYTVEPDPFDMVSETAAVTPPVTVPTDPTVPVPTPKPVAVADGGGESESIPLNPRRGGIFDRNAVVGLPLGSSTLTRTFDELAFYVPGVNPPPQAIGNSVGPGVGGGVGTSGQFSVNGQRSRANNFTVDGSDNNDEDIGVRRQGFFTLVPQPIESVQEFQIITLLAPAEFGRSLGAQVNALSKSGGNGLNGSIYGFFNDERLNARNYFDNADGDRTTDLTTLRFGETVPVLIDGGPARVINNAGEKDQFSLLHGGFAVGGRIVRNKAFFFISGEEQRLEGTRESHFAVPTVEQRSLFGSIGGLQQCFGVVINGICTDGGGNPINFSPGFPTSVDGDAVFSLFPFANDPGGIYGRNTYSQALSTDATGRVYSARLDLNLFKINSNQQTFTARYNYTDDERDLTDVGGALFSAIRPQVRTDNFSTFLNGSLTNSVSNELRVSWGRTKLQFDELPDTTGFLRPVSSSIINSAEERRFLLNAPLLFNVTLPTCFTFGCIAAQTANYQTTQFTTQQTGLGPVGQVNIAGFSPVGVDVFNFPQERQNDTYQIADTVRWQRGRHTFAGGIDFRRVFLESDLPRNSRPLVTFNGAVCFTGNCASAFTAPQDLAASGAATGFFQSLVLPNNDSSIRLSYNQFNFFGQDEWRVTPKLNITLGLRYEYNTTPEEQDNKIERTFQLSPDQFPDVGSVNLFQGFSDFINGRTKIYDEDRNNIAPRIGFAWAPSYDTVIRGGYGLYYDQIIGSVVSQSRNVFPTFTTANTGGGDLLCNTAFQLLNPITGGFNPSDCSGNGTIVAPGTLNTLNPAFDVLDLLRGLFFFPLVNGTSFGTTLPTRKLDTPLSHQYSVGIEQRLWNNSFFSVAYVGTTGRSLLRSTTPNLGNNYIALVQGFNLDDDGSPEVIGLTFDPFTGSDLERPNPNIGPVNQFETTGRSQYHSLQIALRGRLARSFHYQANYVYGNVKDDVSDVFDLAGASALPQNSQSFAGEYAPANFDVRHRFTYNFIYGLPRLHDWSTPLRHLFGGWELAGTGRFNTGQPFTVNSVFDVNFDGNLTDRLDNTQFISIVGNNRTPLRLSCTTPAECQTMLAAFGTDGSVGRNSFRAGNILDLDLALSRRFHLTETQDIQFRIDFFNFIDRANFGIPVRYLEAPAFGSAVQTITPGRRVQFGLKYNF